tara:strand:+ start:1343 stop:2017 length:675 start_codon:yes stop_codon:yes gene_type:complete
MDENDFLPPVIEATPEPQPVIEMESEEEQDELDISGSNPPIEDEIFKTVNFDDKPQVKEIVVEEPEPEVVKEPKKKVKRPRTQKQLEALAKNRAKLKAKREETKRIKEEAKIEADRIVKERMKSKNKDDLLPSQRRQIEYDNKLQEAQNKADNKPVVDVEGAIYNALSVYDKERKTRKAEKKKRIEKERIEQERQNQLKAAVQAAIQPGYKPETDVWQNCFNFH